MMHVARACHAFEDRPWLVWYTRRVYRCPYCGEDHWTMAGAAGPWQSDRGAEWCVPDCAGDEGLNRIVAFIRLSPGEN